ncbi:bifunctional indole-3-glycerol-phosphate synthase TrpC/phosphoribosylanthranilate isomerase TrpF [Blochmannia endosymbiont of Polyrhachis (Hedomyrma) turneri]|uniref:bifunctional indole-3-glycerol-phosphate synthase TrpC/phosphoribosylanthranilate isomerase TrpF n=1 Tax=Blochmannia endosymbiont of Polyrhachis (Hedomyrma) turneri TaxID=1505596 RepID=UPI00061A696F|nr:bifunctional indole-3-glycerol-phosphate synthase TrpC/phosphoribosylanthranilate isomerase TrpF [Blochmannia endosymbiont of Polyrhachis (Hedomyrma) turneri]AKC59990.1 tryptophan biosynthesis protein trpCF [Blochmannia endosymbiont of Polyrhachis (Hedomyrma) turneri]
MNNSILEKIIFYKKNWIHAQIQQTPLKTLQACVQPSTRNFYHALNKKYTVFILECKKASPSGGIICKNFNIAKIANVYKHHASAISVLTDEKFFCGNFNLLHQMSQIVQQPILCKDFIISKWQIYFSRLHQADAVLLMLSILDDETYQKLQKTAKTLNMEVLTEVTNQQEWERAMNLGAKIIGINNRNLHDFTINLERTITLAKKKYQDKIIISESGINHYRDIRKLCQYVDGFLIGSALTSQHNINIAIKKIFMGENKICGLTRATDAQAAHQSGAIYGGLIFVPESPRTIDIDTAYHIICSMKKLYYVGVFRNSPIEHIIKIVTLLKLSAVQLHGQENTQYINILHNHLPKNCSIWKALNANEYIPNINYPTTKKIKRYVLDNHQGGSGKQFDWSLLKNIPLDNIILSGGLTTENCHHASTLGCAGLDFNSGVETTPGIKDHQKLNEIFQILRSY